MVFDDKSDYVETYAYIRIPPSIKSIAKPTATKQSKKKRECGGGKEREEENDNNVTTNSPIA